MNTAYLGIGSNLGNRKQNIERAIALLREHRDIEVTAASALYECPALTLDGAPQPDYLNGAIEVRTSLGPLELLDALQAIERELGRPDEHGRWQPRTIDLDMLMYDLVILSGDRLTLPHPEMTKRMFVLKPLCDIAAALKHPETGRTIREHVQDIAHYRAGPHRVADLEESEDRASPSSSRGRFSPTGE